MGRYRVGERIGEGGTAEVFRAEMDGADGFARPVAIKRLRPSLAADAGQRAAFRSEADLARRLHHGCIVQVLDVGEDDQGVPFLVTELVDGCSLAQLLDRGEPLTVAEAITAVDQVLAALDHAHSHEGGAIVHRDVNPRNVLVSRDGVVKLADFGIAKASGRASETLPGTIKGTLAYLSPEQAAGGEVDARSDQFAVGLVLCELIAGESPLGDASSLAELLRRLSEGLPRLPGDDELADIAARAVAIDAEARFSSAAEMRHALEAWRVARGLRLSHRELGARVRAALGDAPGARKVALASPEPAGRAPTRVVAAPRPRRWPARVAVAAVALAGAAAVAYAWLWPEQRPRGAAAERAARPAPAAAERAALPAPAAGERQASAATAPLHADAGTAPAPAAPAPAAAAAAAPARPVRRRARQRTGTVDINLLPWAQVLLDGRSYGQTPRSIRLPAGRHELVLENPRTGQRATLPIEIEAGQTLRISRWPK